MFVVLSSLLLPHLTGQHPHSEKRKKKTIKIQPLLGLIFYIFFFYCIVTITEPVQKIQWEGLMERSVLNNVTNAMDGEDNIIIVTKPVKCATRDQPCGKATVLVCGHKVF